jgi:predicted site-specific integrase-resolvase
MSDGSRFVTAIKAADFFGVSTFTIRAWRTKGYLKCIKPPDSHYRYDLTSFKRESDSNNTSTKGPDEKKDVCTKEAKVCYCRVSSRKQSDDLKRQIAYFNENFPDHEIVKDIGSGLNYKRKGLLSLLKRAIDGNLREIVVAHRDRLCRFGIELIEWFFQQYSVKVIILDKSTEEPEREICSDILSVLHVFSCRVNGKRRYSKKAPKETEKDAGEENSDQDSLPVSDD